MTEDEVSNMIYGIKQMHDMRMEKLYEMFRKVHKLDEYCTDPVKLAARKKVFGDAVEFGKSLTKKKGSKK
jgi:hypothetical protein